MNKYERNKPYVGGPVLKHDESPLFPIRAGNPSPISQLKPGFRCKGPCCKARHLGVVK